MRLVFMAGFVMAWFSLWLGAVGTALRTAAEPPTGVIRMDIAGQLERLVVPLPTLVTISRQGE